MVEDFTSLRPWMQFANDSVFSIPKERIITICNVAEDMKSYYRVIIEKVKARAKIKKTPLTHEDIKRAAEMLERLGLDEELSEEDYELFNPEEGSKTLH